MIRTLTLAGLFVLAISLTGCFKFKQTMTLMSDGSGKINLSIGLSEQLVQMAKQQGEDPFSDMSPMSLSEDAKGIVAFSEPVTKKEGGYTYLTFDAYFEDINEVELGNPDDEEPPAKFAFVTDGNSATLTVEESMVFSAIADYEPISPEDRVVAAQITSGMLFSEVYHLPGTFEAIEGVESNGQTATIEVTQENMLDGTGPIKDLKGIDKLTFKITEIEENAEAMKTFKAELEAAKKEWQAMKEEAAE